MADKTDKTEKAEKAEKTEKTEKKADKGEKRPKRGRSDAESRGEPRSIVTAHAEVVPARFAEKYVKDVIPALTKQFSYKNPNQVPRLRKIVLNMGLGAAVTNPKIVDAAVEELRAITGQKPVVTRAKKAIASFKLRAGI